MPGTHRVAISWLALLLSGCGYVGDPLPPALNIPVRIENLRAVQRGDSIFVTFTVPTLTTEGLPVRRLEGVDLRIGPTVNPFNGDGWAGAARAISTNPVEPGSPVEAAAPASEWYGKQVTVAVRLVNQRGRRSEWSNLQSFTVREPLPAPELTGEPHPKGVRLTWPAQPGGSMQFRIWRQGPKESAPSLLSTATGLEFVDDKVVLGQEYLYRLQATADGAESDFSVPVKVMPRDIFPPSVPGGLTAVASLMSVELGWARSPEEDVEEYRIYRGEADGEFSLLAGGLKETAHGDRQITSGRVYRYAVTAVDRSGNESARSAPVVATAP